MKPIFVRNVAALWLSVFALVGGSGCGDGPVDPVSYALGSGEDGNLDVRKLKPVVSSINPVDVTGGDEVTLTGKNFGKKQGLITVQGVEVATDSWSATKVTFTVPNDLPGGPSPVILQPDGGKLSSAVNLNIFAFLTRASTAKSVSGKTLSLIGHNFGVSPGDSTVLFGKAEVTVSNWTNETLEIEFPAAVAAAKGDFTVKVGGLVSNKVAFTLEPALTALTPNTGPPGTSVTLTGTSFGAKQEGSTLLIDGQPVTVTKWTSTAITFLVPAGSVVAIDTITVKVGGLASNPLAFSVTSGLPPVPAISGVSPVSGFAGTPVVVNGSDFGATQGSSTLNVGTTVVTPVAWSATQIQFVVPSTGLTAGSRLVSVTVQGQVSNQALFSVRPSIVNRSPSGAPVGTIEPIVVEGLNFGTSKGTVRIGNLVVPSANVTEWTDTSFKAVIPAALTAGTHRILVVIGGQPSNAFPFELLGSGVVTISDIFPVSGAVGSSVTLLGSGFGNLVGTSVVTVGGNTAVISSWSDGQIDLIVPAALAPGSYDVVAQVSGQNSNAAVFTVNTATSPQIISVSPVSGLPGDTVRVNGLNFGATQGASTITIGGINVVVTSWSNSAVVGQVPPSLSAGRQPIVVTVGGEASNTDFYTITPLISGVSPDAGPVGTPITLTGIAFGASQAGSILWVGGVTVSTTSWSNNSITAMIPIGLSAGGVVIQLEINEQLSNPIVFTVQTSPVPAITSVIPDLGGAGTVVTVTGSNFGATQGIGDVRVGGVVVAPLSWAGSTITFQLPGSLAPGATTVAVSAAGQTSNAVAFVVLPVIDTMNPTGGAQGLQVTLSGTNFGGSTGNVQIGGLTVVPASWSNVSITFAVPSGLSAGAQDVSIFAGGQFSNSLVFTSSVVGSPVAFSVSPNEGLEGITATLSGSNFGATQGASSLNFGGILVTPANWTATSIEFVVPDVTPGTYAIAVTVGAITSNSVDFAVTTATSPQINSLTPTSGLRGATVTIAGENFGATAGSVTIGGFSATVSNWSATSIAFVVPGSVATGSQPVIVTAGGVESNTAYFSVRPVTLLSLSPVSGAVGATVTATGSGFGASQAGSVLSVGGTAATVSSWNGTTIVFDIPAGAAAGAQPVVVVVGGQASNAIDFVVTGALAPQISSVTPPIGTAPAQITLAGLRFGAVQGSGTVTLGGVSVVVVSWSNTSVTITIPATLAAGNQSFVVTTGAGAASNPADFTVVPTLSGISPIAGETTTTVTVSGSNLGSSVGASTLSIGGVTVTPSTWVNGSITFDVPPSLATGDHDVSVVVGGQPSNSVSFQVTAGSGPTISSVSPSLVAVGATVTVTGTNFGATAGLSTLSVSGSTVTPLTWNDTSITFSAPNLPTGNYPVVITVGGTPSNSVSFAIQTGASPVISSVGPSAGPRGVVITVSGAGFGLFQGSGTITFDGTSASVQSWGDTAIQVLVPSTLSAGSALVQVTASGTSSNTVSYTVRPLMFALSPTSGVAGDTFTLTGSAFGAVVNDSVVIMGGGAVSVQNWSDTSIVLTVPGGLTLGSKAVSVTVNGQPSNALPFAITAVTTPEVNSMSPATATVGQTVTLTGSYFGANQGTGTITIGGVTITPTSWSDTEIVFVVPTGMPAGDQDVVVTVLGDPSNLGTLTIAPDISSASPLTGTTGATITLVGTSFGNTQLGSTLLVGGILVTPLSWNDTAITFVIPSAVTAGTNAIEVFVAGETSGPTTLTVTPSVTGVNPASGSSASLLTIGGTNFGDVQGGAVVTIGGMSAQIASWSEMSISVTVPTLAAGTHNVVVTVGGESSNNGTFRILPAITGLSPSAGTGSTAVTLSGTSFGGSQGGSTVSLGGQTLTAVSWSDTSIQIDVPTTLVAGTHDFVVVVNSESSLGVSFTVLPFLASSTPTSGTAGASVTVTGTNFGPSAGTTSTVSIGGALVTPTGWSNTSVSFLVPAGIAGGAVSIELSIGGQTSNALAFNVLPTLSSISPVAGSSGAPVRLNGSNFGSSQGLSTVTLGGAAVGVLGWSNTAVTFQVPAAAVAGRLAVLLSVGGQAAGPVSFTVMPVITNVVSPGGPAGTGVTLSGHHFGASGRVTVDGRTVTAASWSNTSITLSIPGDLAAGDVGIVVTSAGQPSNSATFTVTAAGAPATFGMAPVSASTGTVVTLTGVNFNPVTGSTITIGGITITPDSWNDGEITFTIPTGLPVGTNEVVVTVGGVPSNDLTIDIVTPGSPYVSSVAPIAGAAPSTILVEGSGFGTSQGGSTFTIDGVPGTIADWSDTSITADIPANLGAGEHEIEFTVGGLPSNTVTFTVRPTIGTATPSGGAAGTVVTLTGSSFGAAQGVNSTIIIAGVEVTPTSWSDGLITFEVPANIAAGAETIYAVINGQPSNAVDFNVTSASAPTLTGGTGGNSGVSPTAGAPGTLVTFTGERFGSEQGDSTLTVNGIDLIIVDWSNLEVTARIPSGIDAGIFDIEMTVDSQTSNAVAFTILPAISSVSPSGGPVGATVTISGDAFGTAQGASTLLIDGIAATASVWSRTSIVVTVPAGAVTGDTFVAVVVDGQSSNAVPFEVTAAGAPVVGSVSPASGPAGTVVTITGTGFGDPQGVSTITIGGVPIVPTVWNDGTITFEIPVLPSGDHDIVISVGGIESNTGSFTVGGPTDPKITGIVPSAGPANGSLTLSGSNFGALQGVGTISIGGVNAPPSSWSDTSLIVAVPASLTAGIHAVKVTVGGVTSNSMNYTIRPVINSLLPDFGPTGVTVAVFGQTFGAIQGSGEFTVGGLHADAASWSDTKVVITIPGGLSVGNNAVVVTIGNQPSNNALFNVTSATAPSIGSTSSTSGVVGDSITLTGTNFGPLQNGSTITVGGIAATVTSWSNTSITYIIPTGTQAGDQAVEVTVGGQVSNTPDITISPAVTGTSPSDATGGTLVTLTGTSFGSPQGTSTITVDGVTITPTSWNDTSITFVLPTSIAGGEQDVLVTVNGETSTAATLTVHPGLTSLTPSSVTSGTSVTLTGTNFGSSEGTNTVTIDGVAVTITSWSSTSITFDIPAGLTAGSHSLQATVGGETGTALAFTVEPAITGLNVLNGTAGTVVILTGTAFGSSQLASTVTLGGVTLTPSAWSDGSITVTIPSSVKAGVQSFEVTVNGEVSDAAVFTVAPSLGTVSPSAGTTSTSVTVTGTNFGSFATGSTITIGGVTVTATAWSTTSISFVVPALSAGDQNIEVVVGGQSSGTAVYTVQPFVGSVSPGSATGGTLVSITGNTFGLTDVGNSVTVGGIVAAIDSWSDSLIEFTMPGTVTGGTRNVVVTVNGEASTVGSITVVPAITSPSPVSGPTGTNLTLAGTGYGAGQGASTMTLSGSPITPTSWSSTSLALTVPGGLAAGDHAILVTVGGQTSAAASFTVTPFISNVSPSPVTGGTTVTVTGTSFGTGQGGSSLLVDGVSLVGSAWTDLSLSFDVPTSVTAGTVPVSVVVNGEYSNIGTFVVDPSIYALTPVTGAINSTVTLTGANFGATKGASTVTVDGITATTTAWSSTSVDITIPASLTAGSYDVVATVGGRLSNATTFDIAAGIASVTPGSGAAGTWITVSGTAFGASQGGNEITVGGVAVVPATWTTTSIQFSIPATVPAGAGSISLTIGGLTTTYLFTVDVGTLSLGSTDATGGDSIIITGTNFGTKPAGVSVTVGGVLATVNSVGATSIDFEMPDTVTGGTRNVIVTVNGEVSAPESINVTPSLISALPASRTGGESITLTGTNLGASSGDGTVLVGGVSAATTFWSQTSIVATMPDTVTAGTRNVWVVIGGETSGTQSITVTPSLGTFTPTTSSAGNSIVLSGTNFGGAQDASTFTLAGIAVTTTAWSQTSISWTVPNGSPVGSQPVVVTVGGQTVNTNFTVTIGISLAPTSGTGGDTVTINGTGFGADDNGGASTVTIAGVPVTTSSWSDTAIQFQVPVTTSAGAQPVTVTVGAQNNSAIFTVNPAIVSLTPGSGTGGATITLAGTNLGATQLASTITVDGVLVSITSWSSTSIQFEIPDSVTAGTRTVSITVGGQTDTFTFDVEPALGGLSTGTGTGGTTVSATGTNLGSTQGSSSILIGGVPVNVTNWYASVVTFTIPNNVTAGVQNIAFNVGSQLSNTTPFTVQPTLVGPVSPASGTTSTVVTVGGTNFGTDATGNTITIGGVSVAATAWSMTSISFAVPVLPAGDATITVEVGGEMSNPVTFTVQPFVGSIAPSSATGGTLVTITGTSFGPTDVGNSVTVGGIASAIVSWNDTSIQFTMPDAVTGGTRGVVVMVNGEASTVGSITVVPAITSPSPVSGPTGTNLTLSGTGFGAGQGASTMTLSGSPITPTSWSSTSLALTVPGGLAAGDHAILVTVGGQTSAAATFTVTPFVSNISPSPVTGGTTVTVTGTSFGTGQGGSSLLVDGVSLGGSAWTDLSLNFNVPTSVTAGTLPVSVVVNGEYSNIGTFVVDPSIYALTPVTGTVNSTVTLTGANFGATKGASTITVDGITATTTAWSSTSVDITIPASLTAGSYDVVALINGRTSNSKSFDIAAGIASVTPGSGSAGTWITVSGTAFGASQGGNEITVGGVAVVPATWTTTSIQFSIPATVPAGAGSISLTIGGLTTTYLFTVDVGTLSLGSTDATGGDSVIITGTNFGTNPAGVSVTVGGVLATVNSVGPTSIDFEMPDTVTGGTQNVIVTVNGEASAPESINVTPTLISALPASRTGGESITLTGTNLGASSGDGTVLVGGVSAATTFWSQTSIIATMPNTVTAGTRNVWVVIGGETSGTQSITVTPTLGTLNPTSAVAGSTIVLAGTNFGGVPTGSTFTLAGIAVTSTAWSQTSISWKVPIGTPVGSQPLVLTVGGQMVSTNFTVVIGISLSPTSGTGGDTVTINGSGFGADDNGGASTVTIANILVIPLSWSDTEIQFQVPNTAPASAQPVTVTVGPQSSDAMFTISPSIVSLSPAAGTGSTPVTLAGTNLGAAQLGSTIEIAGSLIVPTSWSSTSIDFMVPADLAAGSHPVTVTVEGLTDTFFFDVEPFVGGIDIAVGTGGTVVTATGTNYGAAQGASNVYVSGVAAPILNWYPSVVTFSIPNDVTAGVQGIVFDVGGQLSDPAIAFTVTPTQDNVSPASGTGGTIVVLSGTNFGLSQGASALSLGGVSITADVWSQVAVTFTVPATIAGGIQTLALTVNGQAANNLSFTVTPRVTNVTPVMGSALTDVTVTGNGFGAAQGASMVHIGGIPIAVTDWYANVITFTIADSVTGGTRNLTVTVGGETSNATPFVIVPIINSLTPNTGTGLTSVTVSGANFGAGLGTSTVSIGGVPVSPSLWSSTSFTFAVPTTLAAGTPTVVVTVGGQSSAGTVFTLKPSITGLNPLFGSANTSVTVTGTNFGPAGVLSLGGVALATSSWADTTIVFAIPVTMEAGILNIVVTSGSQASNAFAFTVTPSIKTLSPNSGAGGTVVTIDGTNFGAAQDVTSTVTIGGLGVTPTGWNHTTIVFTVPDSVTSGTQAVVVTVGGQTASKDFVVAPVISSLNPTSGVIATQVTITGKNFGASEGASIITIDGVVATATGWSPLAVTFTVPAAITGGTHNVLVTVAGQASNPSPFTVIPSINLGGLAPNTGPGGTAVTISGNSYGGAQGASTVWVDGIAAMVSSWSSSSVAITMPNNVTAGTRGVVVRVGGEDSAASNFTVTPAISSLSAPSGVSGTTVTITGTNFGDNQSGGTVTIAGIQSVVDSWAMTSIDIRIPSAVTAGTQNIVVTAQGQVSNGAPFTVGATLSSLNPLTGTGGTTVTVSGVNFGTSLGASTLNIGGFDVVPSNWYAETVTFAVPNAVTGGTQNVVLTIGGEASNALPFTVVPTLTSLSTLTGPGGTSVTLSGTNFGAAQGTSTVAVDGINATITSWGASSVIIDMPDDVTAGTRGVVLTAGGQASNAINFTVTPAISSLSALIGSGGTPVTITGTNFGGSALPGTVTVGGVAASVGSWDMTSISITIPNAATGGTQNVVVTSFGQASNPATFAVTPTISGLNPVSGTGGDSVTISGTNFGTVAGSVNVGGFIATTSGWYADTVTFAVPAAVTAGTQNVFVSIGGQDSNTSIFTVAPSITGLSPASGIGGTYVTISGTNFGATEGASTVSVGGFFATATTWSSTSVVITIPNAVTAGTQNLVVTVSGQTVSTPLTVRPAITVLTPDNGTGNDAVVITGTGFGDTQGASTLTVAGVLVGATAWDSTSISFTMPTSITAQTAAVVVTVASQASAASNFLLKPNFTLISPDNGNTASTVTLTGTNFGTVQGGSTVLFGVASAPITGWYNNKITATVPLSLSSAVYTVTVVVGGQTSPGLPFTATAAFLVASAETLDCQPVDGHIDHYRITYNEAVNDSTFEGYVLNTTGSVTARWEVAGRLNVRLQHGTSVPAACGTDVNNDSVQYLKFDPDTGFDTGEKPDITTTAALVSALAAPAGRTMFGTGTLGASDIAETDKAGPFVYYARGAEAGAPEGLVGPGDTLEIRFSETTNAAVLAGIDLDTVFALTTFFDFGAAGDISGTVWTQTDVTNDTLVVTFATVTPTVAIGNTIKARGTDIFDLAFNIPAAIADVLTPPVIAGTFEAGPIGPYVTDADYYDIDADGHLDHVRVEFSASVLDNTFPGYVDTSTVGAVTTLWLVAGHSSVAMDPTVAADVDNDNVIWLSFSESSSFDTGVKPDLTATASASQLRDSVGCYFNANNVGSACTDSAKAVLASADVNEGDKAPPIIMHATGKAGSDKVFILFSENVWGAPGRPACGAGGEFTVADFSYGDIIAGGATSFVNMDNDVCAATDALVSINTDIVLDANDVNFDLAKPNSGTAIYDQADNAMAAATSRVIAGTTAPYLVGASSFKVGANFFLRVVYSEDVNAAQALTASNYSVIEDPTSTCTDIAATPTSVSQVSGNIYDIQTGTQCGFTPLTFYRVTVTSVTDSNEGEVIGVPNIATTLGTDTSDVTPPRLLEAKAITPTTVQLTFSEPMKTGNVNGTAECASTGFPLTCAADASDTAGTQLKYTLLPTLGAVTSVLKTANTSVFILTHASIQSGTFYSVTAVDTALPLTGQILDASTPGVRIGSVPRNQATFQGMGALITQATDGPLFSDPFGDGTTNNFAFTYASRVYVGPNGPNNGNFRFEADGANPLSVQFVGPSAGVTCLNSVSFGVAGGTTCVTPTSAGSLTPVGPTGEQGVVGFNSGTVTVLAGATPVTREILMVGPIKDGVNTMYFSEDVDTSLNFNLCTVAGGAGANSKSVQAAYSWGSNMYMGISSAHNNQAPFLNKIPLTLASSSAPLVCGTNVYFTLKDNLGIGKANGNVANGTTGVVGIDSMLYVPTGATLTPTNTFYIANNGGVARSVGEPMASTDFVTFMLESYFAGFVPATGDNFTLVGDSLDKTSPGRKGLPFMIVYKDVMFMARNVAVSNTTLANLQASNGGELWKCSANCTTNSSWSRVFTSSPVGTGTGIEMTNNKAVSLLQVSGGYLYVGFDNMVDGARMYRTSVVPTGKADFEEVGRIASRDKVHTNGTTSTCSHGQSLGGICMGYQILSSSVITKNQYSYIYFTVGCTLISQSGDEQLCDINNNPSTGTNLPAMSVLIQRD